jgi:hypothetical protein
VAVFISRTLSVVSRRYAQKIWRCSGRDVYWEVFS